MDKLIQITELLGRVSFNLFGVEFKVIAHKDKINPKSGRIYIQTQYSAKCNKSAVEQVWFGSKYYLSDYMTNDEVIKKAYVACQQAVNHEVMEAFKVDGIILFNPHVDFEELLKVSHKEVTRNAK